MLAIPDAKSAPAVDQRPRRDYGSLLQKHADRPSQERTMIANTPNHHLNPP
jgi:phage baseplate assembly protein W